MTPPRPGTVARGSAPAAAGVPEPRFAWWEGALLVLLWLAFAASVSGGYLVTTYDSFRDMAATQALLRGAWGGDPTLPDLPAWYPAGQALLCAAVAKVARLSAVQAHGSSLFWFGWTLPLGLHLLVRRSFGRAAAWAALAFLVLGSQWWLTHLGMAMPSIQGVSLGALVLIAWDHARTRGVREALACGAAGALALGFHPLCGGMALAAALVHGVGSPWLSRGGEDRRARLQVLRQSLVTVGSAALLSAPFLVPVLSGPVSNPAPRIWFGPELRTAAFALHAHTPWVLPLGLAGLVLCAREWSTRGWLVGYAAVGLVGTLAGYAGHEWGWPVPYLIPHEFQWHLQLAWCVAAAWATLWLGERFVRAWPRVKLAPWAISWALAGVTLAPSLAHLGETGRYPMRLDASQARLRRLASEVAAHGPPGAIVATDPELAYFLAGLAGTRAQMLPEGHMNPRANVESRAAHVQALLEFEDEARFRESLRTLPVDLLLHVPPDTSESRRLDQRYHAWTVVRPIPLAHSSLRLYQVVRDTLAPPRAPERIRE